MNLRRRLHFIWRYLRGNIPWDSREVPPEVRDWIAHYDAPPGRALDLGCGPGTTAIYLAQQGWHTVGVDFAPNAIMLARRRARREARNGAFAGTLTFLSADVTRPVLPEDDSSFDLLVDVGCLHALPTDGRPGYAANVKRLSRPGTTLLLYAFLPFTTNSGRSVGISRASVRDLLDPAFTITDYTEGEEVTTPRPSAWYTLQCTESGS